MKGFQCLGIGAFLMFGTLLCGAEAELKKTESGPGSQWEKVWSDEFSKSGLPDPKDWTYEEGFVRNNEEQYYTRARRQNARIEKGCLVIEARKESFVNKFYQKDSKKTWRRNDPKAHYTSAALITEGKHNWQYGRIEVKAKLPKGKGVWPAIWMLGADRADTGNPRCGEIDIMEYVNGTPKTVYATVHFPNRNPKGEKSTESKGNKINSDTLSSEFHLYAFEWYPDRMDFFLDDQKFHTVKMADVGPNEPFHKPFYLLINLAIGGSWGGEVDPAIFPQQFLIDYVRIYKLKAQNK